MGARSGTIWIVYRGACGVFQAMRILHLDGIRALAHHEHFPTQLLAIDDQRDFITGVKTQHSSGQGHVGAHAEVHLRAWQGLNISPTFLGASRQSCIVWEEILESHMANGWRRHHLEGSHRGREAVCSRLKGQRGLRLQKCVTKCPVPERFHRVTPVWLALTLDQELHVLRQASTGLGLHFHVHPRGDRDVFWGQRDMDLTRWQIAQGSHEETHRFPEHVWLHESHEHCGQPHHGAPRETQQPALTHDSWHAVLLHLPRCTMVQRLHQVKGHTVGVGPFEDFRVEL